MGEERYDIRDSTGVQAGDHNLQFNVTAERRRGWFITITALVVVVLAVAVYGLVKFWNRADPRPDLEVSAFAVAKPSKVSGQRLDVGSREVIEEDEVDTTAIDVTLKNNGDAPAVLTGLQLTVQYAKTLQDCRQQGGEVVVAAEYLVSLPEEVPPAPFTLKEDIRFEVRGGVTDRFTITVGPGLQAVSSLTPWMIVTDVALRKDDGELLKVGTAAVVTQAGEGLKNLFVAPPEAEECLADNARLVDEVFKIPATRAEEFTKLKNGYARLARATTQPGRETCAVPPVKEPIFKVCAMREAGTFQAAMGLTDFPEAGASAITLHLRSSDKQIDYTYKYDYDVGYDGALGWQMDVERYQNEYPSMYLEAFGPGAKDQSVVFTGSPNAGVLIADELEVEVEWTSGGGEPSRASAVLK